MPPRPTALRAALLVCVLFALALTSSAWAARHHPRHHHLHPRTTRSGCADPDHFPATRNPANPLMLPVAPGANPLNGAHFFVNGAHNGAAAGVILRLLGMDPHTFPASYSWARLSSALQRGGLHARLAHNPALAHQVALMSKVASQPEEQRWSLYSAGGGPGKVYSQVEQFFCDKMAADPGTIPIFTTYFLYQRGYCESASTIRAYRPRFERQVNEMAAAIGHRPAVLMLELDAIGASSCMLRTGALGEWERDIAYEIGRVAKLPHVVAYIEAGYADAEGPAYTAMVLRAVGANRIRGFYTNDTHNDWTISEIRWGWKVSRLAGGLHFVVNTDTNGRGPLLNPDPATQGIEDLCNAPGRGLGPRPTTTTGFRKVDAYLWTGVPGNSAGGCHGGPAPGMFWPARAMMLAANAQGMLGPGFARDPY